MNFDWNADTIRWYQQANEYTGFFQYMAELVAPKLVGYETLCDIGCGLGLIDLQLSRYVPNLNITCMDINERALQALQEEIREQNVSNITPIRKDYKETNLYFDVILTSFFGSRSIEELIGRCKTLIMIVGDKSNQALFPDKFHSYNKNKASNVELFLNEKNIAYTVQSACCEFGQPFTTKEDAKRFVIEHSKGITNEELEEFLENHLVKAKRLEYAYFLPHNKTVTIFQMKGNL